MNRLLRILRRAIYCWNGHAPIWRRTDDGAQLECFHCLTVFASVKGEVWNISSGTIRSSRRWR